MTRLIPVALVGALLSGCASQKKNTPDAPQVSERNVAEDGEPTLHDIRIAAIEKVVNETSQYRHDCWEQTAAKTINFSGTIVLRFVFGQPGEIAAIEVLSNSTKQDSLSDCLVAKYETHEWPPVFDGATPVELPFAFKKVEGQYVVHRDVVSSGQGTIRLLSGKNTGNPDVELTLVREQGANLLQTDSLVIPIRGNAFLVPAKCNAPHRGAKGPCKGLRKFAAAVLPNGEAFYTTPEPSATAPVILVARISSQSGNAPAIFDQKRTVDIGAGTAKRNILIDIERQKAPAFAAILSGSSLFRVAEHTHDKEIEMLYVLDGGGKLTVAGESYILRAGHAVQIPAGVKHAFVSGDNGISAIQIYVPVS